MKTNSRLLGTLSLICLVLTVIWLALFVYVTATDGAIETYEEALESAGRLGLLHYVTYGNATLITVSATMLFGGLYVVCRPEAPLWASMGAVFVPIYGLLNLFAYLSQITVVPRLVALRPASDLLVAQLIQAWPNSTVGVVNNLGYAVLGIPSVIYGVLLGRGEGSLRVGGVFLALSGAASMVGFLGIVARSDVLGLGSIVGGVLFLAALVPLSRTWLR